jgi:hypothetical protein
MRAGTELSMSFEDFVRAPSAGLSRVALLLAGQDRAQAEDLAQGALERAYRHGGRICRAGDPERYVAASWQRLDGPAAAGSPARALTDGENGVTFTGCLRGNPWLGGSLGYVRGYTQFGGQFLVEKIPCRVSLDAWPPRAASAPGSPSWSGSNQVRRGSASTRAVPSEHGGQHREQRARVLQRARCLDPAG